VVELVIDDVPVRVLGLEGLVLTKEGVSVPHGEVAELV
jgi:hypothetical protein